MRGCSRCRRRGCGGRADRPRRDKRRATPGACCSRSSWPAASPAPSMPASPTSRLAWHVHHRMNVGTPAIRARARSSAHRRMQGSRWSRSGASRWSSTVGRRTTPACASRMSAGPRSRNRGDEAGLAAIDPGYRGHPLGAGPRRRQPSPPLPVRSGRDVAKCGALRGGSPAEPLGDARRDGVSRPPLRQLRPHQNHALPVGESPPTLPHRDIHPRQVDRGRSLQEHHPAERRREQLPVLFERGGIG